MKSRNYADPMVKCARPGRRYWEFDSSRRNFVAGCSSEGRPLRDLGLPDDVTRVDAAFQGLGQEVSRRSTYIVSGEKYWRLSATRSGSRMAVHNHRYPKDTSKLRGVPTPVDSAYTDSQGTSCFFLFTVESVNKSAGGRTAFQPRVGRCREGVFLSHWKIF